MRPTTVAQLTDRNLLLILTFSPAGLGHLRVTDALYGGLPATVNPVVLGGQDKSIQTVHRLTSVNPVGKAVFDWPLAARANRLYRSQLRADNREIYGRLTGLLTERMERPETILVVCTHFGLAHKLAAIKEELERRERVRMVLAVVVTDDTLQHVWYVDGADLLVVPSLPTKKKFIAYGEKIGSFPRIEVLPYPIHPLLGEELDAAALAQKERQLDARSSEPVHVSIPISGAAVGTDFLAALMEHLRKRSDRFLFHVVGRDAPYTQYFLSGLAGKPHIDVRAAVQNRQVVDLYDVLMRTQTLSLEVTKPSEQTFKCLAPTRARGGVIMLFTQPVGTQELDNLDFLRRHSLVPSAEHNELLWQMARNRGSADASLRSRLLEDAARWRGVSIPDDALQAANFIWWMLQDGFLSRMQEGCLDRRIEDEDGQVLGPDGVARFWDLVTSI
jgi:hypothetical protein